MPSPLRVIVACAALAFAAPQPAAAAFPAGFAEDTTPPAAPVFAGTAPASPANDNAPRFRGTAEAGSIVRIYSTADCSVRLEAVGTAADFADPGLSVAVSDDATVTLYASATDAEGNTSACSAPITYREDSSAPVATFAAKPPEVTTDPTANFTFSATEPGVTFECRVTGPIVSCPAQHETEALGGGAATMSVRAIDAAGNIGPIAEYRFVVDTHEPEAPVASGSVPASPANETAPRIIGSAEEESLVRVYTTADCTGAPVATGPAASLAGPGLQVTVPDDSTTTFRLTATDPAGNTSACSGSALTYVEDSTPPETTITGPAGPTSDPTPRFELAAGEPGVTLACRVTGEFAPCTTPHDVAAPGDGSHSLEARATDPAGNTDPTPAVFAFTVDTRAPSPPVLTETDPPSPSPDTTPFVRGAAEASSTVSLFTTPDCGGLPVTTGAAAAFAASGFETTLIGSTTQFRATATDAAGNVSDCSPIALVYVVSPGEGSISINAGARYTNRPRVTVSVDPPAGAQRVSLSNDALSGFQSFPVTDSLRWRLATRGAADLRTTVFARFDDALTVSDDIVLDRTPPLVTAARVRTRHRRQRVRFSALDTTSGVARVQLGGQPATDLAVARARVRRTIDVRGANAPRRIRVIDAAGNRSNWKRLPVPPLG